MTSLYAGPYCIEFRRGTDAFPSLDYADGLIARSPGNDVQRALEACGVRQHVGQGVTIKYVKIGIQSIGDHYAQGATFGDCAAVVAKAFDHQEVSFHRSHHIADADAFRGARQPDATTPAADRLYQLGKP